MAGPFPPPRWDVISQDPTKTWACAVCSVVTIAPAVNLLPPGSWG